MVRSMHFRITLIALALGLALGGCRQQADVPGGAVTAPAPDPGTAAGAGAPAPGVDADADAVDPGPLEDVMLADPRYIIGISYPPGIDRYPGLAAGIRRYSDAARAELMQAVEGRDPPSTGSAGIPYDLALPFDLLLETPRVVAVQATGTVYTGGAHGNPLVARFVWLPGRDEMLRAEALFTDPQGWRAVSAFVRESLFAALSQRLDADQVEPEDRARLLATGGRMIDEGTAPVAANFQHFEPVPGGGDRLRALRFVFPPYQVGPYSDGVQTVEVPASVLWPWLAAEYRELFVAPD